MLSPHEIAALLLLGDAQDIDDLEPESNIEYARLSLNTVQTHDKALKLQFGASRCTRGDGLL
ncbi:hypothetical protein KAF44_28120 (plasmid) [Cupriavidus necator]|nr:hypothetical protein KAF44_28120 [Cupriavidus necator]